MTANSLMFVIINCLDIVAAVFSLPFNAVLIFFVLTKSPKQFGTYKYLMVFIAVFEMFMTLQESLLVPILYSHGSAVTVMVNVSKTPFSPQVVYILVLNGLGLFGACLANFAVHFIYRYLVVSGSQLIHTFESWKLIFWFILPLSSGMAWSVTAYFFCSPTREAQEYLRSSVLRDFGEGIEHFEYCLFYLYRRLGNGDISFDFDSLAVLGVASFTACISLFVILFFGFKCYTHIGNLIKKSGTVSSQSNTIQQQLFYALVVQTLIPVLFIYVPTTLLFTWTLFEVDVGSCVFLVPMSVALYCILDPLPNFFIIKPYRRALFDYVKCRKARENKTCIRL